jgi:hypothetical protein
LAAHDRLHNVVIIGVRDCQLRDTPAVAARQLLGAGMQMPMGVRIRRLSRQREGNASGPVLVTCHTPVQAFQLIRDVNNHADGSGLRARHDLSPEEREAKAARRRLNAEFQTLVKEQGLHYQWRGAMRTQLWVEIPTAQGMDWQHIPPRAPARAPGSAQDG